MANRHKGEVPILIGGKQLVLRFDANALVELEDQTGLTLSKLGQLASSEDGIAQAFGIKFIRGALYSGLKASREGLTIDQVGDWMDLSQLSEYTMKIADALNLSLGGPDQGNVEKPDLAVPATTVSDGVGNSSRFKLELQESDQINSGS